MSFYIVFYFLALVFSNVNSIINIKLQ